MSLRAYRTFQALILACLGMFLLFKVVDGRILLYISQRFIVIVLLAAVGLIVLAQLVLRERPIQDTDAAEAAHEEHHHEEKRPGWALWLVALPLLAGLLVPERPLGASTLQSRGINTSSVVSAGGSAGQSLATNPDERSVLDWIRIVSDSPDSRAYEGQAADVTGFVYHDIRFRKDQFLVGRFAITCCVADAVALGMVVDWPEAAGLPDNTWVRVRGQVHSYAMDGKNLPSVQAQAVETIPQPEQPYLFP